MKSKVLDIKIDEKNFKIICLCGFFIIVLFCLSLYLEIGTLTNYKLPENISMDNGQKIQYTIDRVVVSNKYIEIVGWSYKKGQNVGFFNSRFLIKNLESGKYKALKTGMTSVDELFSVEPLELEYVIVANSLFTYAIYVKLSSFMFPLN